MWAIAKRAIAGTIRRSLCHLDPSGELPTIALLYDAELEIASATARRRSSMRDFIAGYLSVNLAADEMLTRSRSAPGPPGTDMHFLNFLAGMVTSPSRRLRVWSRPADLASSRGSRWPSAAGCDTAAAGYCGSNLDGHGWSAGSGRACRWCRAGTTHRG